MAWTTYSEDIVKTVNGDVISNNFFNYKSRFAYRLYADEDTSPVKIRIDITYVKVQLSIAPANSTNNGGFWNGGVYTWFIGNRSLFDQNQYNLNNDQNADGSYKHEFKFPYSSGYVDSIKAPYPEDLSRMINHSKLISYNSSPLVGAAYQDTLTAFSSSNFQLVSGSDVSNSPRAIMWGTLFNDKSKFSGSNASGQEKIYIRNNTIIVASSSLRDNRTNAVLTYDQEANRSDKYLTPVNPYINSNCLASLTTDVNELQSLGCLRNDVVKFGSKQDSGNGDYLVNSWCALVTIWARFILNSIPTTNPNFGHAMLSRSYDNTTQVALGYSYPDYQKPAQPPEINGLDDNTVFRCQKKYVNGQLQYDKNGNPIMEYVKCPKIGLNG